MPPYSLPLLIASDHAGWPLKQELKNRLRALQWKDLGSHSEQRTDYPDWARRLCQALQRDMIGVLICGSGQGMCMQANRYPNIRAALCWDENTARLSKAHNKANVLCLPGRILSPSQAVKVLNCFLKTDFEGQKDYQRRVLKLSSSPP